VRTRIGRFELANGGSIFLEQISEMSPGLQVKILRSYRITLLKDRRHQDHPVDIRVIAATNRDLEELVPPEPVPGRPLLPPQCHPHLAATQGRISDIRSSFQHFLQLFSRTKKKPPNASALRPWNSSAAPGPGTFGNWRT